MKSDQPIDAAVGSSSESAGEPTAEGRAATGVNLVAGGFAAKEGEPHARWTAADQSVEEPAPLSAQVDSTVRPPVPSLPPKPLPAPRLPPQVPSVETTPPGRAGSRPSAAPVPPAAREDRHVGTTIDNRYLVEAILGEGGMGIVYGCRHTIIDKKVAIKVLRNDFARDREVTERFLMEAKAASAIGNPHIIDISDFGYLPDGSAYFVMEYLDGFPLSSRLEGERPLPLKDLLSVALQLADGLGAAHAQGIVHRDLKPDNIFLIKRGNQDDFVKILDFGIAKVSTSPGKLTQAGSVFGTPHYMSPEQAAGQPVDQRGDIYAFGVMLYELACGRVPFDADNYLAILNQHLYKSPLPLHQRVNVDGSTVPAGLEAITLKCLSKRAEQRYSDMRAVRADLELLLVGNSPRALGELSEGGDHFTKPGNYFADQADLREDGSSLALARPASSPRQQTRRKRWLALGGVVASTLLGVSISAVWRSASENGAAQPAEVTPGATASTRAALDEGTNVSSEVEASTSEATNAEVTITNQVVLGLVPLGARAYQQGKDLGPSPVVVDVPEGRQLEVEIRHPGYRTQRLMLDGHEQRLAIELQPLAAPKRASAPVVDSAATAPAPKKAPGPKPQIGGGEIVNPWAN